VTLAQSGVALAAADCDLQPMVLREPDRVSLRL
jgi:hypothetical protein